MVNAHARACARAPHAPHALSASLHAAPKAAARALDYGACGDPAKIAGSRMAFLSRACLTTLVTAGAHSDAMRERCRDACVSCRVPHTGTASRRMFAFGSSGEGTIVASSAAAAALSVDISMLFNPARRRRRIFWQRKLKTPRISKFPVVSRTRNGM